MAEQTLLPCNASELERAIDVTAAERLATIPHYVRSTDNPDTIPPVLLPWLAWARRVEVWDSSWSDDQKRAVIKASFVAHRRKGTPGAIRTALGALGLGSTIVEWFNDTPQGQPYTFKVVIDPLDVGVSAGSWPSILGIIQRTKNVRSHFGGISTRMHRTGSSYSGGVTRWGMRISIPAGEQA